jgi:hypothetical protein
MALVINDRVKKLVPQQVQVHLLWPEHKLVLILLLLGIGGSNTTYYAIFNQGTNEWEVGLGTLDAGATTLTRTTVLTSSNSDAAVNFTSGTKDVFCTLPASKAVYLDSTGAPVGAASNGFAVAMAIAL